MEKPFKKPQKQKKSADKIVPQVMDVKGVPNFKCDVIEHDFMIDFKNFPLDAQSKHEFSIPMGVKCTLLFESEYDWDSVKKFGKAVGEKYRNIIPILLVHDVDEKFKDKYYFSMKILSYNMDIPAFTVVNHKKLVAHAPCYRSKFPIFKTNDCIPFVDHIGTMHMKVRFRFTPIEPIQSFVGKAYTKEASQKDMMFMDETVSDVTVLLKGKEKFPAHKVILAKNSTVFAHMLKQSDVKELKITADAPLDACYDFFRFIYTSRVRDLAQNLESLVALAIEYDVPRLRKFCLKEIIRVIRIKCPHQNVAQHLIADEKQALMHLKTLGMYDGLKLEEIQHYQPPVTQKANESKDEKELKDEATGGSAEVEVGKSEDVEPPAVKAQTEEPTEAHAEDPPPVIISESQEADTEGKLEEKDKIEICGDPSEAIQPSNDIVSTNSNATADQQMNEDNVKVCDNEDPPLDVPETNVAEIHCPLIEDAVEEIKVDVVQIQQEHKDEITMEDAITILADDPCEGNVDKIQGTMAEEPLEKELKDPSEKDGGEQQQSDVIEEKKLEEIQDGGDCADLQNEPLSVEEATKDIVEEKLEEIQDEGNCTDIQNEPLSVEAEAEKDIVEEKLEVIQGEGDYTDFQNVPLNIEEEEKDEIIVKNLNILQFAAMFNVPWNNDDIVSTLEDMLAELCDDA